MAQAAYDIHSRSNSIPIKVVFSEVLTPNPGASNKATGSGVHARKDV